MATSGWPSTGGRPNSCCSAALQARLPSTKLCDVVVVAAARVRIDFRIPHAVVDAVDDAEQVVVAVGEDAFEAVAQRRRLDLLGVARADGGDHVGERDAALEEVEVAVELHLPPVEVLPVDAGELHVPVPEAALVGDVVDREHRRRANRRAGCRGTSVLR